MQKILLLLTSFLFPLAISSCGSVYVQFNQLKKITNFDEVKSSIGVTILSFNFKNKMSLDSMKKTLSLSEKKQIKFLNENILISGLLVFPHGGHNHQQKVNDFLQNKKYGPFKIQYNNFKDKQKMEIKDGKIFIFIKMLSANKNYIFQYVSQKKELVKNK